MYKDTHTCSITVHYVHNGDSILLTKLTLLYYQLTKWLTYDMTEGGCNIFRAPIYFIKNTLDE